MKKGNLVFGIILVVIGLFFLLVTFNVIPDLSFLEFFRHVWPLGLVIAGVLLIMKLRMLSLFIFVITVILGLVFFIVPDLNYSGGFEVVKKEISHDYDSDVNDVVYDVSFGAGILKISKSFNESKLIEGSLESTTSDGAKFEVVEGATTVVKINREEEMRFWNFFQRADNKDFTAKWDLRVNGDVPSSIKMNYGVSEVFLDLRGLNIDSVDIDCGVSNTDIIFGNESVDVHISSGVSDFNFEFTEDVGIVIEAKGGLVDVKLKDFTKIDDRYYSPNYVKGEEMITINVDSGVTSIKGRILE